MIHAFEQTKAEAARAEAEVLYCEAQICSQGDVWNLLQYVMSRPKDDLAPEKSKLIPAPSLAFLLLVS